jgi:NitT/TauT family transport system permease protein
LRFVHALQTNIKDRFIVVGIFVIAITLWQFTSTVGLVPRYLIPAPTQIGEELLNPSIDWPIQILATTRTIILGFTFGTLGGLALAFLTTSSPLLRKVLLPCLIGGEALPKIAIAPVLYIILGFNDISRIVLVFFLTFFPIVIATATGLVDVDQNLLYLLRSLGATETKIFYKIRLPNSLPHMFDGLRLAAISAVAGAVVAEFISSSAGLGYVIINAQNFYDTSLAFAAFTLLGIISLALYGLVDLAAYLTMPWFRKK